MFSCPACSINYLQEMFAEICKSLTSWGHLSHARFHQFHQLQLHQTSSSRVHSASVRFGLPPKLIFCFSAELFNINCSAWQREGDRDRSGRVQRVKKVLGVSANTKGFDPCPFALTFDEWTRIRHGMNEHFK